MNCLLSIKICNKIFGPITKITANHVCASFQVDANAIFVDYSNVTINVNFLQSISDMRVAARYLTK
jgi:hypothetical protein